MSVHARWRCLSNEGGDSGQILVVKTPAIEKPITSIFAEILGSKTRHCGVHHIVGSLQQDVTNYRAGSS